MPKSGPIALSRGGAVQWQHWRKEQQVQCVQKMGFPKVLLRALQNDVCFSVRDSHKYKMNNGHRGKALIFVHTDYEPALQLKRRRGSKTDVGRLQRCFSNLGFKVKTYNNLNINVLKHVLHETSQEDHSNRDCLAVTVLTHGEEGRLYAQNGSYPQELLWSPFTADRCPTLVGKPKLFFIQACRGPFMDSGVQMPVEKSKVFREANDNVDLGDEPSLFEVETDFLVAFATVYGYVSWKREGKISWFIEILCEELSEERSDHLLTILTDVQRRVADFSTTNPDDEELRDKKQIPCVTHRLKKLLYFNDSNYNNSN